MAGKKAQDALPPADAVLTDWRQRLGDYADQRLEWLRANLRATMDATGMDGSMIYAMTGVAGGTTRGFLGGADSGIRNVLLIAAATGFQLKDLIQPPADFAKLLREKVTHKQKDD